jgi:hypothetical protein
VRSSTQNGPLGGAHDDGRLVRFVTRKEHWAGPQLALAQAAIGWRAAEPHFVPLLQTVVAVDSPHVLVVGGAEKEAESIADQLETEIKGVDTTAESTGTGFTGSVRDGRIRAWLEASASQARLTLSLRRNSLSGSRHGQVFVTTKRGCVADFEVWQGSADRLPRSPCSTHPGSSQCFRSGTGSANRVLKIGVGLVSADRVPGT